MIDLKKLIQVGAHFGHQTSRWCPKMARYIWGTKNNVHLIDVSKTAYQMDRAAKFLESVAAQGKCILWVGTKKAAQDAIHSTAVELNLPFVTHRWIGGTLSNYSQVKKSVTKMLHLEDVINKTEKFPHYTKKEINVFTKAYDRLNKNVGGIRNLTWPLGAIVLVDVLKEQSALKEAVSIGLPVIALVDTNGDPSLVNYVIPANDDAPQVVKLIIGYLADAVKAGQAKAVEEQKKQASETEQAIAARQKSGEGQSVSKKGPRPAEKKPASTHAPKEKTKEKVVAAKSTAEEVKPETPAAEIKTKAAEQQ